MEQNKTLLIIFSAALFLASILSVGWFFYPREEVAGSPADIESAGMPAGDPIEWVRRNEIPALTPQSDTAPKEDLIIVYGEKTEQSEAETPPAAASSPYPPVSDPPASAPVVIAPPAPRKEPVPEVKKPRVTPPAPKPAPAPETRSVRVKEFSIQVGAFSSRGRAEELNEILKEKGLSGQVFYADGPKLYRLRIGPYTNKAEAEKFLGWVRTINGFESSMIFERNATQTVVN